MEEVQQQQQYNEEEEEQQQQQQFCVCNDNTEQQQHVEEEEEQDVVDSETKPKKSSKKRARTEKTKTKRTDLFYEDPKVRKIFSLGFLELYRDITRIRQKATLLQLNTKNAIKSMGELYLRVIYDNNSSEENKCEVLKDLTEEFINLVEIIQKNRTFYFIKNK
ncbi:MAG: hypothetical protein DRM99_04880 [Thermoplasmata archaeon]|nr:MAG: hypothetical protein DRM99_04880 [Thermoplasmata archaeon]